MYVCMNNIALYTQTDTKTHIHTHVTYTYIILTYRPNAATPSGLL